MKKNHFIIAMLWACLFANCKKSFTEKESAKTTERKKIPIQFSALPEGAKPVSFKLANGKSLELYSWDSLFIYEGDMLLTKEQVDKLIAANDPAARAYHSDLAKQWLRGTVPFVINAGFTAAAAADINFAISDWASTTSVTFVTRTTQTHYIEFMPSTGNNSHVGMIRGRQVINLAVNGPGDINWSSAIHEIGHALGMYHEQSRVDRDNFITINTANIRPGVMHNFETYLQQGNPGTEFGTFDFASIMLYPSFTTDVNFVFNTAQPMMTRLNGTTWGANFFVSGGDVDAAQLMYGPPFAKMRYLFTDNYNPYGDVDRTADIIIEFYADAACTVPTTLAVSRSLKVEGTIEEYYQGGWRSSPYQYNVSLPTGVTSFQLDDDLIVEQITYDYGNIYSGYRDSKNYYAGWIRQVTNL